MQVAGSLVVFVIDSNALAPSTPVCSWLGGTLASEIGAWAATIAVSPSPLGALTLMLPPPTSETTPSPSIVARPKSLSSSLALLGGRVPEPSKGLTGLLGD